MTPLTELELTNARTLLAAGRNRWKREEDEAAEEAGAEPDYKVDVPIALLASLIEIAADHQRMVGGLEDIRARIERIGCCFGGLGTNYRGTSR